MTTKAAPYKFPPDVEERIREVTRKLHELRVALEDALDARDDDEED